MPKRDQLLNLLADGRFHSGEVLGAQLGISRQALYRRMERLGIELERRPKSSTE